MLQCTPSDNRMMVRVASRQSHRHSVSGRDTRQATQNCDRISHLPLTKEHIMLTRNPDSAPITVDGRLLYSNMYMLDTETGEVVPHKYRYTCPETGEVVYCAEWEDAPSDRVFYLGTCGWVYDGYGVPPHAEQI